MNLTKNATFINLVALNKYYKKLNATLKKRGIHHFLKKYHSWNTSLPKKISFHKEI